MGEAARTHMMAATRCSARACVLAGTYIPDEADRRLSSQRSLMAIEAYNQVPSALNKPSDIINFALSAVPSSTRLIGGRRSTPDPP